MVNLNRPGPLPAALKARLRCESETAHYTHLYRFHIDKRIVLRAHGWS